MVKYKYGGRSSKVERLPVEQDVAGALPVDHPYHRLNIPSHLVYTSSLMLAIEHRKYSIGISARYGKPTGPFAEGYYYRIFKLAEGLNRLGHNVILMAHPESEIPQGVEHYSAYPTNAHFNGEILDWQYQLTDLADFYKKYHGSVDIFNAQTDHMSCFMAEFMSDPILHTIAYANFGLDVQNVLRYFRHQNFSSQSKATMSTYPYLNWVGYSYNCIDVETVPFVEKPHNYLVYAARIAPDKGTRYSIEVAKASGVPLVIAGPIQDNDYFEQFIKPQIDGSHIRYAGYLPKHELLNVIGHAVALIDTSVTAQNFPNTFLEAQACGTPVISFRFGSALEIMREGVTGQLSRTGEFQSTESLINSVSDLTLAVLGLEKISRHACRIFVAERFNPKIMIDGYLALYRAVIKNSKSHYIANLS